MGIFGVFVISVVQCHGQPLASLLQHQQTGPGGSRLAWHEAETQALHFKKSSFSFFSSLFKLTFSLM